MKYEIASVEQFSEPGDRQVVEVDGTSVVVIYFGEEFFAVQNVCPHQGGPVGEGRVKGKLTCEWSETGERTIEGFDEGTPTIACPFHGYEFELESGRHIGTDDIALRQYHVSVENETIFVHHE